MMKHCLQLIVCFWAALWQLPSSSAETTASQADGYACFQDGAELRSAVNQFIEDGCSDTNHCNNNIVQKYGWPMGSWCVGNVTDMSFLFTWKRDFNDDISSWNVSSVTDMGGMFLGATSFNQDLSTWEMSSVKNMQSMLAGASSFNQVLSVWDVSSAKFMSGMFYGAEAFNQDLSTWDVSSVTNMHGMFLGASSFNQDLSTWNVSSVQFMGSMFKDARAFNQDLSAWDVSSVTDTIEMFYGAKSFNQELMAPPPKQDDENFGTEIYLGEMSYKMTQGRVIEWLKNIGDEVERGEPLCVVESDTFLMLDGQKYVETHDVVAQKDGVLAAIYIGKTETVPVGSVLGVVAADIAEASLVRQTLEQKRMEFEEFHD